MYGLGAEMLNEDPEYADDDSNDFRSAVRRVWFRARESLRALSPSLAPHRTDLLEVWTDFGRKCGADVNAPYDPAAEAEFRSGPATKSRGCSWIECLCFGERPNHRLRMCKRCTKAFYCSKKCQTK